VTLAAVVIGTLPLLQGCFGGTQPVHLDSLHVWYAVAGRQDSTRAGSFHVAGLEGQQYMTVIPTDSLASAWWYTTNTAGQSCKSNTAAVNATTDVPVGPPANGKWFDVQGRRTTATTPGVYFGRRKRVVK